MVGDLHSRIAAVLLERAAKMGRLESISVDDCLNLANHLAAIPPIPIVGFPTEMGESLVTHSDLRYRVFVAAARSCVSLTDWPNAGRYFRCALRCVLIKRARSKLPAKPG